jgi:hypothetical protein
MTDCRECRFFTINKKGYASNRPGSYCTYLKKPISTNVHCRYNLCKLARNERLPHQTIIRFMKLNKNTVKFTSLTQEEDNQDAV